MFKPSNANLDMHEVNAGLRCGGGRMEDGNDVDGEDVVADGGMVADGVEIGVAVGVAVGVAIGVAVGVLGVGVLGVGVVDEAEKEDDDDDEDEENDKGTEQTFSFVV